MEAKNALGALRERIRARSGASLARGLTYKGLLELLDEAIADIEEGGKE